jgi:hypothetical protein
MSIRTTAASDPDAAVDDGLPRDPRAAGADQCCSTIMMSLLP